MFCAEFQLYYLLHFLVVLMACCENQQLFCSSKISQLLQSCFSKMSGSRSSWLGRSNTFMMSSFVEVRELYSFEWNLPTSSESYCFGWQFSTCIFDYWDFCWFFMGYLVNYVACSSWVVPFKDSCNCFLARFLLLPFLFLSSLHFKQLCISYCTPPLIFNLKFKFLIFKDSRVYGVQTMKCSHMEREDPCPAWHA